MNEDDKPSKARSKSGRVSTDRNARTGMTEQERREAADLKQLHELQVHQVELEMQNEELKKVRAELHASLDRYSSLYELAPVVLMTLGPDSSITDSNQAATDLLQVAQPILLKRRLGSFVVAGSLPAFNACLDSAFQREPPEDCEVELYRDDGTRIIVQITLVFQESKSACLAALVDVTHRHELLHENRQLTRRMFELLESDRRNLAHEIHAEMGQWLTAIYAETGAMLRAEHKLQPDTRRSIRAVTANTAEMQNVLRRILLRLRPTMLDTVGLTESLRELFDQWRENHIEIKCNLSQEGDLDHLGEGLNITIFRIVQDALTNIAQHAKATHVDVRLERTSPQATTSPAVVLTIVDDGVGFDTTRQSSGLGLLGMRERVIAMDGRFDLSSQPGHGVTIRARIPLHG